MPLICCLYVLSYLDRGNIGNAKAAGAREDLGLSDSQWAWVLNSFYIIYVCFEWATLFWKLFPAHIYISILCIWSILLDFVRICTALTLFLLAGAHLPCAPAPPKTCLA